MRRKKGKIFGKRRSSAKEEKTNLKKKRGTRRDLENSEKARKLGEAVKRRHQKKNRSGLNASKVKQE